MKYKSGRIWGLQEMLYLYLDKIYEINEWNKELIQNDRIQEKMRQIEDQGEDEIGKNFYRDKI